MLQEHSLSKKVLLISSSPNLCMHCFTRSLSPSSGEKREDHLSVTHVDSSHNFYDEHRPTHGPHDHLWAPGEKLHPSAQRNSKSGKSDRTFAQGSTTLSVSKESSVKAATSLFCLIIYLHRYSIGNGLLVQALSDCTKSSTSLPDAVKVGHRNHGTGSRYWHSSKL